MPKWQRSRPQSHAGFSSVVMWETLSSVTEVMWTGAWEWAGWWYPIENSRGQVKKLLKYCTFSSILFFFFKVHLTLASGPGTICVSGTDPKIMKSLWGGPLSTNLLLSSPAHAYHRSWWMGYSQKNQKGAASSLHAENISLDYLQRCATLPKISLKQQLCQKWGCKFKCIEANQSLFSIYYPFCCQTWLLLCWFSSGKHRLF